MMKYQLLLISLLLSIICIIAINNDDHRIVYIINGAGKKELYWVDNTSMWYDFMVFPYAKCTMEPGTKSRHYRSNSFEFHPYNTFLRDRCIPQRVALDLSNIRERDQTINFTMNHIHWLEGNLRYIPPPQPSVILVVSLPTAQGTVPPSIFPLHNLTHTFHEIFIRMMHHTATLRGACSLYVLDTSTKDFSEFLNHMPEAINGSSPWGILHYELSAYYQYLEYILSITSSLQELNYEHAVSLTIERYPIVVFPWRYR